MRKSIGVILLLLSMGLLLAGCGGKNDVAAQEADAGQSAPATEGESAAVAGDPVHGQELYSTACVACHGPDAKGVAGLGKSLHPSDSEFVRQSSDEELMTFIKVGRQPGEQGNTTGVAMPPKGGNPALSEGDLADIVAYIRTLE